MKRDKLESFLYMEIILVFFDGDVFTGILYYSPYIPNEYMLSTPYFDIFFKSSQVKRVIKIGGI